MSETQRGTMRKAIPHQARPAVLDALPAVDPAHVQLEPRWGLPQSQPGKLRALIMCRLSRDSEDSTSIATQERDGRTLAQLRDWDVVAVTYDVGVSGSIRPEDRPGFGWALRNLANVDVVIARSVDRFTRTTAHFAGLVESLDKGGTTLVDTQGQVDLTSPYGRFVTTIMVAFAQMEREMIQSRILRSRGELRRAGRWLGGAAPYGFRIVDLGKNLGKGLDLDEYAAGVLNEVIDRVTRGHTLSSEVDRLNHSAHLSPGTYRKQQRGEWFPPLVTEEWTYSALYQHLRSEVLRGYRVVGKRATRKVVRDEHGAPVRVGPPLVSDERWFDLKRALDDAAVDPRRPRRKATLLLHVAWCANCDEAMYYNTREYGPGKFSDGYTCSAARLKRVRDEGRCPGVFVNAAKLEAHVADWVLTRLGRTEFTEQRRVGGSPGRSALIAELESDITELASSLVGLRGAAKDAVLGQLEARQEALDDALAVPEDPERLEWVSTGRTVAQEWEARAEVAERRLLLLELGLRATVTPAYGVKHWNPDRVSVGLASDPAERALASVALDLELDEHM